MKFWPNSSSTTTSSPDRKRAGTSDRTSSTAQSNTSPSEARTTLGNPVQRPLTSPAPHPHITHYSPDLVLSGPHTICRCLLPTVHGDAFTRRHHASSANGIAFLSPAGEPISWEQAANAFLDALGVDSRVSPGWHMEDEALLKRVFHPETVRCIRRYHEVWKGVKKHGALRCALEDDVYWWGPVNPKGVALRTVRGERGTGEALTMNGPFYGGQAASEPQSERVRRKRRGVIFQGGE